MEMRGNAMGKKMKLGTVEEDPPEKADSKEHKRTCLANYSKVSGESLHAKEREMMEELAQLQADIVIRSCTGCRLERARSGEQSCRRKKKICC